MDSESRRPLRLLSAIVLAPVAAPLAIMTGTLSYNVAAARPMAHGSNSVAAVFLLGFFLFVFGAPLMYGSAVLVLWPVASALDNADRLSWWKLTLVAGVAGAVVFPAYLRLLAPRGSWQFFPGAGFVAGAATGLAFWYVATGPRRALPALGP